MKKITAHQFLMGAVFLLAVFALGGWATSANKSVSSDLSSISHNSSAVASSAPVVCNVDSTAQSSASTPSVYRIDTATLASAKTSTDDSLIGTSGIKHSFSYKDAISNGALVSIANASTGYAVYNTAQFDAFIKNPTAEGIWVFHYILNNGEMSIHEMELIQYNRSGFTLTGYDPYSGSKGVMQVDRIVKEDWPDAIRYGAAAKGANDEDSARIMSFSKICVYS